MSYTDDFTLSFGAGETGKAATVRLRFYDATGAQVGSDVSGLAEVGATGSYLKSGVTVPDGAVAFLGFSGGSPSKTTGLAALANRVSTVADKTGYSGTATNMVAAAPTVAEIWAAALTSMGAETTIGGRLKAFVTSLVYAAPPGAAPSAETNAEAVRTELAAELADVVAMAEVAPDHKLAVGADGSVTAGNEEPIAGDVLLTQATVDDSGEIIGKGTPGAKIMAYLSADTGRTTPERQCTVKTNGDWSLGVALGATYALDETLDGYVTATRTVTV
jgi:hypothetical protein